LELLSVSGYVLVLGPDVSVLVLVFCELYLGLLWIDALLAGIADAHLRQINQVSVTLLHFLKMQNKKTEIDNETANISKLDSMCW